MQEERYLPVWTEEDLQLLTVAQTARILGVSKESIRRWAAEGYLEFYTTPGGQRRFDRRQIEAFIKSMK